MELTIIQYYFLVAIIQEGQKKMREYEQLIEIAKEVLPDLDDNDFDLAFSSIQEPKHIIATLGHKLKEVT